MTTQKKEQSKAYSVIGRIGGKANFAKKGRDYYVKIGKKGAKARWKKK